MAKTKRILLGGIVGAMVFALIWWFISGELVVVLVAAGCGALIGSIAASRLLGKVNGVIIVVVVGVIWLYMFLGKRGYLHGPNF